MAPAWGTPVWATHGGPTDKNAHPHVDCTGSVAVIHNGIIENFAALRDELEREGHEFGSETDTEVVAHLIERELPGAGGDLTEAFRRTCRLLEGSFTLLVMSADAPGLIVAARRNSPLVVGLGSGQNFLASDVSAFIAHTRDAVEIGQDEIVELRADGVTITDFDGQPTEGLPYHVDWDASAAEKGGHPYFMLKEILEQPTAVADTLLGRLSPEGSIVLDEERLSTQDFRDIDKVFIVACGSAYHAGLIAKYAIEHWTAAALRSRDGQRVPLSRSGARPLHARGRDQPERRDPRHADGDQACAGAEGSGAGDLQHQRLDDSPGPTRLLDRARSRGGSRSDQDVSDPVRSDVPRRALPRAGTRNAVRRRGRPGSSRTSTAHRR